MPDNFDENMSLDEINELFEDVIEMPEVENIASKAMLGTCNQAISHSLY